MLARIGETITYTYRITNTGGLPFTSRITLDAQSEIITRTTPILPPGSTVTGTHTYTVQSNDLPGPLQTSVTVTATPTIGAPIRDAAGISVTVVDASLSLSKTLGI